MASANTERTQLLDKICPPVGNVLFFRKEKQNIQCYFLKKTETYIWISYIMVAYRPWLQEPCLLISVVRLTLRLAYSSWLWAAGLLCSPPPLGLAKWALMEEALLCWWASNGDRGSPTAPFSMILWDNPEPIPCLGMSIACLGQKNTMREFRLVKLLALGGVFSVVFTVPIEEKPIRSNLYGPEVTLLWQNVSWLSSVE